MKHLNIHDIVSVIQKKNEKRLACFEKILMHATSRIRQSVHINMFSCLYEVPEYLLGYPVYDLNECLTYIIDKLKANGFYVDYYFPRVLHISWNNPAVPRLPSNPTLLAPSVTIPLIHEKCETMREQAIVKKRSVPKLELAVPEPLVEDPVQEIEHQQIDPVQEPASVKTVAPPSTTQTGRTTFKKRPNGYAKSKVKPLSEFKTSGKFVLTLGRDPETESAPS